MSVRRSLVRAPSNIALIKYMGKSDSVANLPENSSLSMTLDGLSTWVEIEAQLGTGSTLLLPEAPRGTPAGIRVPKLGAAGMSKVIRHVERVQACARELLPAHGLRALTACDLVLRSGNTFPEASGIASSASSFAAITLAVAHHCAADPSAFERAWEQDIGFKRAWAAVSRQGSGSSCRSFEGPFVLWEGASAHAIKSAMPELRHFVILISEDAKAISSSEAHQRVKTSPLWEGRRKRVERRLSGLRAALETGDLTTVARLAWSESWEMHSLFHTSEVPFSYWQPGSIDTLHWLAPMIQQPDPPIVTLDAGPNVHLIVRATEVEGWRARLQQRFGSSAVLEDRPGLGAKVVQS